MVGVYHTPLGRFSMVDISTVGIVPLPKKVVVGSISSKASEDVLFAVGTLLVVKQSGLADRPRWLRYTRSYTAGDCCLWVHIVPVWYYPVSGLRWNR